jgi:hypothetical protein
VIASSETFIGTIYDLSKLILKPVDTENFLKVSFKAYNCTLSAGEISKVSSAYWIIGKSSSFVTIGREREQATTISLTGDCKRSDPKV